MNHTMFGFLVSVRERLRAFEVIKECSYFIVYYAVKPQLIELINICIRTQTAT